MSGFASGADVDVDLLNLGAGQRVDDHGVGAVAGGQSKGLHPGEVEAGSGRAVVDDEVRASAVRPDRQRVGVQIRVGDHAIGACPALDDVAAVAGEPLEAVVAGPAVHGVVVPLASEEVVAVAADQQVLTGAAEQGVVVGAAVEPVAAAAAVEQVVAAIPFELVGPVRPGQVVVVRAPTSVAVDVP